MRIVLTSDNHIGKKQYNIPERTLDFANAFTRIIDYAVYNKLDIIAAGDIIDSKTPAPSDVAYLVKISEYLIENKRKLYFISGNHEKVADCEWLSSIYGDTVDNEYGFINIDKKTVTLDDGTTIHGVSQVSSSELKEYVKTVYCDILVVHTPLKELIPYVNESAISINDFNKEHKVVLIGDTHISKVFRNNHQNIVISPGSSEMCSVSENVKKQFYVIDTEDISNNIQEIEIKTREFLKVKVNTKEDLDTISKAVSEINVEEKPFYYIICSDYVLYGELLKVLPLYNSRLLYKVIFSPSENTISKIVEELNNNDIQQLSVSDIVEMFNITNKETKELLLNIANNKNITKSEIEKMINDYICSTK